MVEKSPKELENLLLDKELYRLLNHLRGRWFDANSGFVACTLTDGGKSVTTTNIFESGDKIKHAERRAVEMLESGIGKISPKAVAVVTLSPCVVDSGYRDGSSCSQLLVDKGIKRVHVGLMHEKQGGFEKYKQLGFDITATEDEHVREVSQRLLDLYVANKNLVAEDLDQWKRIKNEVGLSIFKN